MKMKRVIIVMSLVVTFLSGQGIGFAEEKLETPKETLESIGLRLAPVMTYEPFSPPVRNHLWMQSDPDKMPFLHFAKPTNEKENTLLFLGNAIKGRFCAENQPDGGKTGYVHFHALTVSEGHKDAHGGEKGQAGYWLRHVAVGEFDAMGKHFTPGVAHNFKATPPPNCQ